EPPDRGGSTVCEGRADRAGRRGSARVHGLSTRKHQRAAQKGSVAEHYTAVQQCAPRLPKTSRSIAAEGRFVKPREGIPASSGRVRGYTGPSRCELTNIGERRRVHASAKEFPTLRRRTAPCAPFPPFALHRSGESGGRPPRGTAALARSGRTTSGSRWRRRPPGRPWPSPRSPC